MAVRMVTMAVVVVLVTVQPIWWLDYRYHNRRVRAAAGTYDVGYPDP